MKKETEAERQAHIDRETDRNYRTVRALRRSASYRRREEHAEWLRQHRDAPAQGKPDSDKS